MMRAPAGIKPTRLHFPAFVADSSAISGCPHQTTVIARLLDRAT
jgi:hypothetical protein